LDNHCHIKNRADVNTQDKENSNALQAAAKRGNRKIVYELTS
jgi:ankyrin repeat protein